MHEWFCFVGMKGHGHGHGLTARVAVGGGKVLGLFHVDPTDYFLGYFNDSNFTVTRAEAPEMREIDLPP